MRFVRIYHSTGVAIPEKDSTRLEGRNVEEMENKMPWHRRLWEKCLLHPQSTTMWGTSSD